MVNANECEIHTVWSPGPKQFGKAAKLGWLEHCS